ncbi:MULTISPECIES: winged helix-turn-helix transcriptional regulator [unclassified Mesorhizobium]|uniref:winged helix-turn-helix transcriptional regulator n=1 Tax=unclassified Mesorhizobium TaxID=325217 RepID=UPI00112DB8EF|nr:MULTISPECIES: helix-turn-helix domain-containing protein [unclassified Mesorhizobium]MBZ9703126.1 helix-turn-helix transcriptional regulator [Mesorhizobium sp. CO1-1-3]MBZ9949772.1 helix-turn-helix transcriptional regulator [Mesorhizobium sp. BR1-1-11]MBZ9960776.1 helix-turn-helix transcriptional regulator [Mesorhizobium sp. BR1-1-14]TPI53775.1 helix-turn-helix transcriptional regulator [Mesorhizobium sp. B3-1-1]TPJ07701.1 helix-turn-helix transcriptional regulator [Mesorhizobium sp. B2-8-1
MSTQDRSGCPINLSLELLGDRWTLLIIRDLVFAGKKHFREFLQSDEGISSRTLAERLQTLQDEGILTRSGDPTHGLKAIYRLTEAGIDLVPVLATLGAWGSKHRKADDDLARIADKLAADGEPALERLKQALRAEHLG